MGPLALLQLLIVLHSSDAITRTFYIAAVERFWNYKDGTMFSSGQRDIVRSAGSPIHKKAIYMEYSDASFMDPKPREPWTGLLGPIIRLETFDSAVIHFKNLASIPYSLHGVGVSYGKRSEGAGYEDGTNQLEKADDAIPPGQEYTYTWNIPEGYGPVESDPPCITSAYYSHSNTSSDVNSGLVGILLICKPGSLSEDGSPYGAQENILALAVFDERLSHYNDGLEDAPLHTINGFINGSIPEQVMCLKKAAYFHVVGFGTHAEVHRFSLEGHSFVIGEHRVPILPVTAFSFFTAIVNPGEKGEYKLSCQTRTHPEGRMTSLVRVEECMKEPETRSHVHEDYYEEEEDYYESEVLNVADYPGRVGPRSHSKRSPVTWKHYIAAIEVDWDYQPTKNDKRYRFTKVMYREFTNSKFTHQKPSEMPGTGILGPVLRGEVGDQIQIVFKNLARRPFNIYPQGLSSVSSNQPSLAGEQLRDHPIHPNDSITYVWQVTAHDSPASSDPRCLTRFYASFLNLQKDLASGLMGPLLICSKQTLDKGGNQIITDKENILFFCIFDEALSWYHKENNEKFALTLSGNKSAIANYPGGNLIYTINGILGSLQLSICQSEVSVWHVLNLGLGTKLISIYFGGNTFMVDSSYQETLTLIPMNGKTVIMILEKTGQWPVAPDPPLADLGMRATLKVSHCEPHQDEYYDYDHDEIKDFPLDPALYQFPFITSLKSPSSGPRSLSRKPPTSEYWDNAILNDESLQGSADGSQPIRDNEIQNGAGEGEPVKEWSRHQRDTTRQAGPEGKKLVNGSGGDRSEEDGVDFYDDEYNGDDSEYVDMYGEQDPRSLESPLHTYFIAAEEVTWDYGGGRSPYFIKRRHHVPHGFPSYKKVVFREYLDNSFTEPAIRGERDAHLGLLGPCIRAEVNDEIIIQFKNKASRPYSFYSNVLAVQWKEEDSVPPQHTRTYTGKVSAQFGPTGSEECRTWFYTSNGHLYKDFHSGLIGPLLVCRPNVLKRFTVHQISMEDFSLVFMEMDETKSWYIRENRQKHCPSTCAFQSNVLSSCPPACNLPSADEDVQHDHIFHAINGYVGDSLPGLVLPLDRKIRWHLLNVGRTDILPVQFHGNILKQGSQKDHPCSIVNLYPGVGVTLEMTAQTTGLWLIEPEGVYNDYNMTALYLVYNSRCIQPLGLSSGKIKDSQITASGHYGSWLPKLARLGNSGAINAWSVENENSWIQVDLLAPMLIHAIQTQGARLRFLSLYISQYIVFYSLDGEKWSQYQGNTSSNQMVFFGNVDASSIRENHFNPPIITRFVRIRPVHTGTRAGLRMELFGCDLTSCSMSLGMQSGAILPYQLSASSSLYSVFSSWLPNLARLNQQGRINAWRPQADRPGEWFQVDLGHAMKVTGVMVQGARSFSAMYITEFSLSFSNDGIRWTAVQSLNGQRQIFMGNKDSDTPIWVTMEVPVIARYLKLHPEKWKGSIALRMEVLGCGV